MAAPSGVQSPRAVELSAEVAYGVPETAEGVAYQPPWLAFFQRANGTERLSAYRFHASDPLAFNGGGSLLWWVGSCKPLGAQQQQGVTKCGNPVPPLPPTLRHHQERETPADVQASGRQLSPVNVTTYGWYYLF